MERRSRLTPGAKSIARGSTFARATSAISPASNAQRAKVRGARSITGAAGPCDPAHLWARGRGGCDLPACVVALTRDEHRAFDAGELDLLPFLVRDGRVAEMQHALEHADGNLIGLLERLTGQRWAPVPARGA